jgi:hypothetical protein
MGTKQSKRNRKEYARILKDLLPCKLECVYNRKKRIDINILSDLLDPEYIHLFKEEGNLCNDFYLFSQKQQASENLEFCFDYSLATAELIETSIKIDSNETDSYADDFDSNSDESILHKRLKEMYEKWIKTDLVYFTYQTKQHMDQKLKLEDFEEVYHNCYIATRDLFCNFVNSVGRRQLMKKTRKKMNF